MKRSLFLLIAALGSFAFGGMMFFVPGVAAHLLDIDAALPVLSVLRGMGGLIIGLGVINYLLRNEQQAGVLKALLVTNIITHALGLGADVWGAVDGAVLLRSMAPVEATHLFIGIGSCIYYLKLVKDDKIFIS